MEKIIFKTGDKVGVIKCCRFVTGILKNIYDVDPPVAIVDFDGELEKIPVKELAKLPECYEDKKTEKEPEPEHNKEITITEKEFSEKMVKVVGDEINNSDLKLLPDLYLTGFTIFGVKISAAIHKELFGSDEADDD